MTIVAGDYEPVEVLPLDIVGYIGNGTFVLIRGATYQVRKLPEGIELSDSHGIPTCLVAKIENNQVVNFGGNVGTLNNIVGEWCFKSKDVSRIVSLASYTFFEIGSAK